VKLRFSEGEVRLRVDRNEAEILTRGDSLSQELRFESGGFHYDVRCDPNVAPASVSLGDGRMEIRVEPKALRELLAARPSKDLRLEAWGGPGVRLVVEVDLFSGGKGPRRR